MDQLDTVVEETHYFVNQLDTVSYGMYWYYLNVDQWKIITEGVRNSVNQLDTVAEELCYFVKQLDTVS